LNPKFKKFFGFALLDKDGNEQFYQFTVMAYGYAPAVGVVTRLLQPVKAHLQGKGISLSLYVDDGRVSAATEQLAMKHLAGALEVIQNCGWNVQWAKTSTKAEQRHLHLGFFTDSVQMRYFYPEQKQEVVMKQIRELVEKTGQGLQITCKELAKALGRLNSMRRSHGGIVAVMSRSGQHQLGCTVMDRGWEASLLLCSDAVEELKFLLDHLADYNGQHIQTTEAKSMVMTLKRMEEEMKRVEGTVADMENLFVSDASASHAFVYKADGEFSYVLDVEFTEEQTAASSGLRELLAVKFALERDPEQFRQFAGGRIYWQTDSYNCYLFLKKGSRIPKIQRVAAWVKKRERELDVEIVPVWTPRSQGRLVMADLGSKLHHSTDEWGVDREELGSLFQEWDFWPEVDCMAAANNAICKEFFSLVPQAGASGVNFFCQKMGRGKRVFCCLPVKMIVRAMGHLLQQQGIWAVMVVPAWESKPFWAVLQQHKEFQEATKKRKDLR
jgi:hypothetical protein